MFRMIRTHCHHRLPLEGQMKTQQKRCQSVERGGKRNGETWDTWDCKKEDPERNPRKLRNSSLVILVSAGGTRHGRSLHLPV